MCDLRSKFHEDRTKSAVAIVDAMYFGQTQTDRQTDTWVILYLSNSKNCIGWTITRKSGTLSDVYWHQCGMFWHSGFSQQRQNVFENWQLVLYVKRQWLNRHRRDTLWETESSRQPIADKDCIGWFTLLFETWWKHRIRLCCVYIWGHLSNVKTDYMTKKTLLDNGLCVRRPKKKSNTVNQERNSHKCRCVTGSSALGRLQSLLCMSAQTVKTAMTTIMTRVNSDQVNMSCSNLIK